MPSHGTDDIVTKVRVARNEYGLSIMGTPHGTTRIHINLMPHSKLWSAGMNYFDLIIEIGPLM